MLRGHSLHSMSNFSYLWSQYGSIMWAQTIYSIFVIEIFRRKDHSLLTKSPSSAFSYLSKWTLTLIGLLMRETIFCHKVGDSSSWPSLHFSTLPIAIEYFSYMPHKFSVFLWFLFTLHNLFWSELHLHVSACFLVLVRFLCICCVSRKVGYLKPTT